MKRITIFSSFWIAFVIMLFFAQIAIFALIENIPLAIVTSISSIVISVSLLFFCFNSLFYTKTINEDGIKYKTPKKEIFLKWNEVTDVKWKKNKFTLTKEKYCLVFYSDDYSIYFPLPFAASYKKFFNRVCSNPDILEKINEFLRIK